MSDKTTHAVDNCTAKWHKFAGKLMVCAGCGNIAFNNGTDIIEMEELTQEQQDAIKKVPFESDGGVLRKFYATLLYRHSNTEKKNE